METERKFRPKRVISVSLLVLFNISIMASLRNLPLVAKLGYHAISFFLITALFFLIPIALVSAELATGWPKSGGIYVWVKEALGERLGFFAIWMQWVHDLTWFPVILSFAATTLLYIFNPVLAQNKYLVLGIILFIFWSMTLINFFGIKISALFSSYGVILGTVIPGIFIITLGLSWFFRGKPIQITPTLDSIIPSLSNINSWVFITGLFLAFSGLEVSAGYASEVKNPRRNYPLSILYSALIVFFLFLLGSLSIAFLIPEREISLVTGLIDTFHLFLQNYHLEWLVPILGVLLIYGALAETNSWIIGPSKALYTASTHGNLPPLFHKTNKHGTPIQILLFQAIVVSIFSTVFLFMPSISTSYWILTAISAQIYLIMYLLMFISAIRLRYTSPHVPRTYKIPHPHKGIWVVSSVGIFSCLCGIALAFLPPSQIEVGNIFLYEGFLIIGLIVMIAIPLLIFKYRKPHWSILANSTK